MASDAVLKPTNKKCKRVRFTYNDDLVLLREIVGQNPMVNVEAWEIIKQNINITTGKLFSIRTLKQHLMLLMQIWAQKDEVDKIRSGIEEPYSEKDILLQEASSMCKEFNFPEKKQRQSRDKQILELGKQARNKCAEALWPSPQHEAEDNEENIMNDHNYVAFELNDNDKVCEISNVEIDCHNLENILPLYENEQATTVLTTPIKKDTVKKLNGNTNTESDRRTNVLGPSRKRAHARAPLRKNALSYLNEKSEREYRVKQKELELQERKISMEEHKFALEERKVKLDESRFELEKEERMQKIELEKQRIHLQLTEKQLTTQLLQSQQMLVDSLIKQRE